MANMESFRCSRARPAWTTYTRPELECHANKKWQKTEKTLRREHIRVLNSGIKRAVDNRSRRIVYHPLHLETVYMRIWAGASFVSNEDHSFQMGFLIALYEDRDQCHVLDYSSKKSRRAVHSMMGGELYAFTEAFDAGFILVYDVRKPLDQHITLRMFTDSKQVFTIITLGRRPTERRLAINITAIRETYERRKIDSAGLVCGSEIRADS